MKLLPSPSSNLKMSQVEQGGCLFLEATPESGNKEAVESLLLLAGLRNLPGTMS